MNWLTNYVRPKLQGLVGDKDLPDHLWEKCPACGGMVYRRELEQNANVCTLCGHCFRLSAQKRLEMLFDDGKFTLIELPEVKEDPLNFADLKEYDSRLADARKKTRLDEAILIACGSLAGKSVVAGAFDFSFMGGSMGTAVGEAIIAAVDLALLQQAPLILFPASGGARMQEGILSLMQMARTTMAVNKLKAKKIPYLVVLTDPTTGGVTASFAMLGDVTLAEPGAIVGFAGRRVIEQTIRSTLPEGFQKSEYLLAHGMVDMVVERQKIRPTLINIISLLTDSPSFEESVPVLPV